MLKPQTFTVRTPHDTAQMRVRLYPQWNLLYIQTDFLPLEQQELFDALSRRYVFQSLRKNRDGGADLRLTCTDLQKRTLVEDVSGLFADLYKERGGLFA